MIIETVEDLMNALAKLDPKMKVRVQRRDKDGDWDSSEIDIVEIDSSIGKAVVKT